jgi:hypothetical protein
LYAGPCEEMPFDGIMFLIVGCGLVLQVLQGRISAFSFDEDRCDAIQPGTTHINNSDSDAIIIERFIHYYHDTVR